MKQCVTVTKEWRVDISMLDILELLALKGVTVPKGIARGGVTITCNPKAEGTETVLALKGETVDSETQVFPLEVPRGVSIKEEV